MAQRTHVELPPHILPPFEVFVNGVAQVLGEDYDVFGSTLVFEEPLAHEGDLGSWRWIRMFLGIAGTYRKNDSVDVVYTINRSRKEAWLNYDSTVHNIVASAPNLTTVVLRSSVPERFEVFEGKGAREARLPPLPEFRINLYALPGQSPAARDLADHVRASFARRAHAPRNN